MTRVFGYLKVHRRLRRWLMGMAGAVLLYTLLGFLLLPSIVRSVLQSKLTETLGRTTTVESVRFNPYSLVLKIERLFVAEAGSAERFAGFDLLLVNLSLSSLFRLALVVEDLRLEKPFLRVERLEDGRFSFQDIVDRLAASAAEPPPPKEPADKGKPLLFYNLKITGGEFHFVDRPKRASHTLDQFELVLPLVSVRDQERDEFIKPSLRARLNGKVLELTGRSKPFKDTLESEFDFELTDLDLVPLWEYVPLKTGARLRSGMLSCRLKLTFRQAERPELDLSGSLAIEKLALEGREREPLLDFEALRVGIDRFDVFGSRLALGEVRLVRPRLPVVLDEQGEVSTLRYLPPTEPDRPEEKSAFRLTARKISLEGGVLPFADRRLQPAFQKEITPLDLSVIGFDNTGGKAGLELQAGQTDGEHVKLTGEFSLAPRVAVSGNVSIKNVSLPTYRPYLVAFPATVEAALLGVGTDFSVVLAPEGPPDLSTTNGWFDLRGVQLLDPLWKGTQLRWERLGLTGISFVLAGREAAVRDFELRGLSWQMPRFGERPPGQARLAALTFSELKLLLEPLRAELKAVDLRRLALREKAEVELIAGFSTLSLRGLVFDQAAGRLSLANIRFKEPTANLVLEKPSCLNLARVVFGPPPAPPPEKEAEQKPPPAEGATPAAETNAGGKLTLVLPKVLLENGSMSFVDRTLDPPFVGQLSQMEIELADFSTRPGTRAKLTARANAGAQGSIEIDGAANPSDNSLNPSVNLHIAGTDLTTFSPYTLRFVSHPVATGKLDLRVALAVDERKLAGEIKASMTNFTLGEKRESPDDLGIPMWLVLMLLRDSDNNIELEVPLSGSLDDPDFALGKVIWRAIVNVLTKIVTSPFTFLASLVGGGEDIDRIAMEPGQTTIAADSTGKIELLVKAMKKRPGVRLAVAAIVDEAADGEALTRMRVELALKRQKFSGQAAGEAREGGPEGVTVSSAERPKLVEQAARAAGWKVPETKLAPEALLAAQEDFLRASLAAGPVELQQLATARVQAVMKALQADPAISPERLFVRQAGAQERKKAGEMKHGVVIDIQ